METNSETSGNVEITPSHPIQESYFTQNGCRIEGYPYCIGCRRPMDDDLDIRFDGPFGKFTLEEMEIMIKTLEYYKKRYEDVMSVLREIWARQK